MSSPLEAVDLSYRYDTSTPLLENWNEKFEAGELVSIVGRSGQGKSTLLYILGLMLRPGGGEVRLGGRPAPTSDLERARLRARHFGFVFQDAALDVGRSVVDNVLEGSLYRGDDPALARQRALALLTLLEVDVDPRRKPGQVSGGQAQRIALCRALLGHPPLLLADEPTGNLDGESADLVMSTFRNHAQTGATVIVVTHDPRVASRCDRQIQL